MSKAGSQMHLMEASITHTYRGNGASLDLTLRASAQQLGPNPGPNRAVTATEYRESPSLHLALALAPQSPAPPSTKIVGEASPHWEKV